MPVLRAGIPGRGDSKDKVPEVGNCLEISKERKATSVARAKCARARGV